MKITKQWLTRRNACSDGVEWVTDNGLIGLPDTEFIQKLADGEKYRWVVWTIFRRLNRADRIRFAVFCARDVLPIFEKEYPNDDRPRKAIEAAELCIEHNTKANRAAARDVGYAAVYAGHAAYSAGYAAAYSAAYATRAAADSAGYAAAGAAAEAAVEGVADEAAEAAGYAAESAYAVAYAVAYADAYRRYIKFGIGLMEGKK